MQPARGPRGARRPLGLRDLRGLVPTGDDDHVGRRAPHSGAGVDDQRPHDDDAHDDARDDATGQRTGIRRPDEPLLARHAPLDTPGIAAPQAQLDTRDVVPVL